MIQFLMILHSHLVPVTKFGRCKRYTIDAMVLYHPNTIQPRFQPSGWSGGFGYPKTKKTEVITKTERNKHLFMDVLYFIYIQYYSKLSRETGKCFQEKPGEGDIVKNLEIF